MKDRVIGSLFGTGTTVIGVILMYVLTSSDMQAEKQKEQLKTDVKISVIDEIKPEIDKKADKEDLIQEISDRKAADTEHLNLHDTEFKALQNQIRAVYEQNKEQNKLLIEWMKDKKNK